jgi:hypothetical protein
MPGLPGGAGREGPSTIFGVVFVALVTLLMIGALVAALFYAGDMIDQPRVQKPLVGSFAPRHNA